MHLVGPWMSTTGKKKGKKRWASAAQKKQAAELAASWQKIADKHAALVKKANDFKQSYNLSPALPRSTKNIPSKPDTVKGAVTIKQSQQYTGDKILGIGTMHKSNAVPIFSDDEAKDISKMRR
jgi:sulfur relay (sulfurtransferase) DsrC/TusE family protein